MAKLFSHHLSCGFRRDGRRPHEIRKIDCKLSVIPKANGSAQYKCGNTLVIASVFGPQHPKNRESRMNRDAATLIVRCNTSSFASISHCDSSRNHRSDRLIASTIKSSFDSVINAQIYPRCTIEIIIEILQSDGGALSAAINATTLALIDAGIALTEYAVACSAGYIDGNHVPLIDLNHFENTGAKKYKIETFKSQKMIPSKIRKNQKGNKQISKLKALSKENEEQQRMDVDVEMDDEERRRAEKESYCSGQLTLCVLPVSNKIITMQMQSIIDVHKMERLLQIAQKGCHQIHKIMKEAVKQHSFLLMQHRGFINR